MILTILPEAFLRKLALEIFSFVNLAFPPFVSRPPIGLDLLFGVETGI